MDTEINAKPAQAEAGVGAGAELGKSPINCKFCAKSVPKKHRNAKSQF